MDSTVTISFEEFTNLMVKAHGEACKRSEAARILGCNPRTINHMLDDGRLDWACAATRVDVRSIARYKISPAREDEAARVRKLKKRNGTDIWLV